MSEQYKNNEKSGEHQVPHHEVKEHHERLKEHHEKAAERSKDSSNEVDQLSKKVEKHAVSKEDYAQKTEKPARTEDLVRTKKDKEHSFNTTMHHVRQNMSKPERAFSSFIHKPAVEKTSEVLGKTIARPSGIAGATIAAFIGLLSVYSIARFAGFELSGSEMPLLLLSGFLGGLFLEWLYKAVLTILGKKNLKS